MSAGQVGTFQPGHAVQVLSKSSGAWVDAVVHQVLADQAVWVRYGNAQKVILLELQFSTLRRKASSVFTWALGERVQVFSKSQQLWISGVVREVWPNGSVHVQYEEAQHLYKVIAPELQETLLRPFTAVAAIEAPAASRSADQRLVDLAHESECLKATIARQQEQINALLKQKEPLKAGKVPEDPEEEARNENWTCHDCTFQSIQELQECEMCGAARFQSQPSKKPRRAAPAVIDVPLEASPVAVRDLSDGPREFLRQATQVVEANVTSGSQHASQEDRKADESEICEVPLDGESAPSRPLKLRRNFVESLCPYQRHGVAWLWQLYLRKQGGILADEMGLGKTVQACALIEAMNSPGASRAHVLVVMPVTLLDQWAKELARWCPGCPVYIYHGSPGHRLRALKAVLRRGGVLLTSYAIIKNEEGKLAFVNASEMLSPGNWLGKPKQDAAPSAAEKPWDLVICDEAHVMRTISTLLGKAMRKIQARCRILLTGTPVQNALQDLWALMDFAEPGLLGNHATFTKRFNDPIEKGSLRDAPASAVALKKHLCEQLWSLAKPHLLRRTKERLKATAGETAVIGKPLPNRLEFVVWLTPSRDQVRTYQKALETSDIIHEANSKSKLGVEVFRAIGLLKRLCNHPLLAAKTEAWRDFLTSAGKDQHVEVDDEAVGEDVEPGKAVERMLKTLKRDTASLVHQSAKLQCLSALLPALASDGHRTLIFSQGVRMMDLVETCVLKRLGITYLRIDGQTDVHARNDRVQKFQTDSQYSCMLLTTKVGGYGLNLTSADRVIILDPAWNPAVDMQAVDRAHRIGQEREVKTYRLIMSGLIEDKMFRLQVFKMGLTKTALETKQQQRYFTADEIHGLFEWTDPAEGETRKLLRDMHGIEDCTTQCDKGLTIRPTVAGLSSFSYLYNTLQVEDEVAEEMAPEVRLMKAQLKVAEEAAGKAAQLRAEVELSLQKAQQELQTTMEDLGNGRANRSAAGQLKKAQAALTQKKRKEGAIISEAEKVKKATEASAQEVKAAHEQLSKLKEEVSTVQQAADEASKAFCEVERRLVHCIAQAQEKALKTLEKAKAKAMEKASQKLSQALEAHQESKAAVAEEWDKLLDIEARYEECQGDMNIVMQGFGNENCMPLRTSQAARRNTEKEKAAAEKTMAKAVVASSKATEQLNQAMSDFRKTLPATDSGGEATRDQELEEAWTALLHHRDAYAKAQAQKHRTIRGRLSAARKLKEQNARHASVEKESAKASKELQAWQAELAQLEQQVAEAEAQSRQLEEAERLKKRKREECRITIGEAKESLKSARLAEKTAAAERTALYKHYAQADDTLKDALKSARSDERAAAAERQKAIAAIQALKAEKYDANQVVEAYEAKKRVRQDADMA